MKMKKRTITGTTKISFFLMFFLLLGGCSSYEHQFSYFSMMDDKKRTETNKQAAEKFWASVRPVSTLSSSHYRLGLHYQKQGEYEKAIGEFSKALHNDSTYCKAYNGIAMSYDALRRCEPAHASYDQALKCDSNQAYTYNNYACSSLICGDYAKGVGLFLKAEKLADGNARIKNNLRIAQMIVTRESISDHNPVEWLPAPGAKFYSIPSLPLREKITQGHTVDNSPDSHPIVISDHSDIDDIQPDNTPAPAIGANRKNLDLLPALAANRAEAVKLVDEKEIALPVSTISSPNLQKVAIEVSNGNGTTGMAGRSAGFLRGHGFTVRSITNAENYRFEESIIFYKEEYLQVAKELAAIIPGAQNLKKVDAMAKKSIGVRVLLGRDLVTMRFPEGLSGVAGFPERKPEHLLTSTVSVSNNLVQY